MSGPISTILVRIKDPTHQADGQDLSGLSERVGVSGRCGVNSGVTTAPCLSEAFWLIQHVEMVVTCQCEKGL